MIEVELKVNSKTLWAELKRNPRYWFLLVFYTAISAYLLNAVYKGNYFTVVSYHIKHGSLATQFTVQDFWWYTFFLVSAFIPLIVFVFTLPPVKAYRVRKRYPDFKSVLIFEEEKMINDYSFKGVNNHSEIPYSNITKVKHKNGIFKIKLRKSFLVHDDYFINGTPVELETLLKEKCADKCDF